MGGLSWHPDPLPFILFSTATAAPTAAPSAIVGPSSDRGGGVSAFGKGGDSDGDGATSEGGDGGKVGGEGLYSFC
jgi:hypothetical protein